MYTGILFTVYSEKTTLTKTFRNRIDACDYANEIDPEEEHLLIKRIKPI